MICPDLECDISKTGIYDYLIEDEPFRVEVTDSVQDYLELMQELFDFSLLKQHISSGFKVLINCMHGGKYFIFIFFIYFLLNFILVKCTILVYLDI